MLQYKMLNQIFKHEVNTLNLKIKRIFIKAITMHKIVK